VQRDRRPAVGQSSTVVLTLASPARRMPRQKDGSRSAVQVPPSGRAAAGPSCSCSHGALKCMRPPGTRAAAPGCTAPRHRRSANRPACASAALRLGLGGWKPKRPRARRQSLCAPARHPSSGRCCSAIVSRAPTPLQGPSATSGAGVPWPCREANAACLLVRKRPLAEAALSPSRRLGADSLTRRS
jgi:hypothetical protein